MNTLKLMLFSTIFIGAQLFFFSAQAAPPFDTPPSNVRDLENQLNQEITDRTNGDQNLQGQIDQEVTDRTNGDQNLQGQIDAIANAKFSNVTTVALMGGEYTDPAEAMNDYAKWCGEPSLTNPCLLKIMPGVYDIGTNSVVMKRYVDIEGSGENVTKIKGNSSSGVVIGASNAEIRFLSVQNTGGGTHAVAISNYLVSPKITNVTALASGGTTESVGIWISHSQDSALTAKNVTVIVSGTTINYGISNTDSNPTLINMNIKASGGSQNYGVYDSNDIGGANALKIEHSIISGSTNSVYSQHVPAKIGNSRIEGGSAFNTICAGVYDANFIFYTNTCP